MTPIEGLHLALGVASVSAAAYYHRRSQRAFNRFLVVWLMLVIAGIIIGEVFIRSGRAHFSSKQSEKAILHLRKSSSFARDFREVGISASSVLHVNHVNLRRDPTPVA